MSAPAVAALQVNVESATVADLTESIHIVAEGIEIKMVNLSEESQAIDALLAEEFSLQNLLRYHSRNAVIAAKDFLVKHDSKDFHGLNRVHHFLEQSAAAHHDNPSQWDMWKVGAWKWFVGNTSEVDALRAEADALCGLLSRALCNVQMKFMERRNLIAQQIVALSLRLQFARNLVYSCLKQGLVHERMPCLRVLLDIARSIHRDYVPVALILGYLSFQLGMSNSETGGGLSDSFLTWGDQGNIMDGIGQWDQKDVCEEAVSLVNDSAIGYMRVDVLIQVLSDKSGSTAEKENALKILKDTLRLSGSHTSTPLFCHVVRSLVSTGLGDDNPEVANVLSLEMGSPAKATLMETEASSDEEVLGRIMTPPAVEMLLHLMRRSLSQVALAEKRIKDILLEEGTNNENRKALNPRIRDIYHLIGQRAAARDSLALKQLISHMESSKSWETQQILIYILCRTFGSFKVSEWPSALILQCLFRSDGHPLVQEAAENGVAQMLQDKSVPMALYEHFIYQATGFLSSPGARSKWNAILERANMRDLPRHNKEIM
eukprot:TRINITY_DN27068_c0_g1_i1.p1 TRINITY_DN27068_c0_g1~~TRINITY_DN27068_c0_g1_i1.p1  ORF type:complete len:556 (-),score=79.71 TRINITY_DN27068_c0_g1_i1:76-1713(-)